MPLFKDMLRSDQTLFKNAIALDFDYMPKLIPYREQEQHRMARCIRPLLQGMNGRNLILLGTPGVGKTVACRHVLQDLENETEAVIPIYINCWQRNTTHKVVLGLCEAIDYRFIQNKKTEELFDEVKKALNKKSAVFVFDEIDKAEDYSFLYIILESIYKKSVFLITNYHDWINELEERIKSRLLPEVMEFRKYNRAETEGILKERLNYSFYPGVFSDDAFRIITNKAFSLGDIRAGLHLLREAGNAAEDESSKKIEAKHAEIAIKKLSEFSTKNEKELEEETKKILDVIRGNSGKKIGELYKIFQESGSATSYKTFQRKISKLYDGSFVELNKISGGPEGTTTIVTLKDFGLGTDEVLQNETANSAKKLKKEYKQLNEF